jgi:hypothetical protein
VRLFLLCFIATVLVRPPVWASEPATAKSLWTSLAVGQTLDVQIFEPKKHPTSAKTPFAVVLYLKNLAAPRVGTESDDAIISDFLQAEYLVVSLDFKNSPRARVPHVNRDLGKLRDDIRARTFLKQYKIDNAHVYIVPSGHRLKRDIPFYHDGERQLALDLIYPSNPAHPSGTLLEFSCDNQDRMGNASLSSCSDTLLDSEATEGFAVAMADHPVAAPYKGIDPMPDCARKIKSAVRTLRTTAQELKLGDKIVPIGFSRGSGMALMLVTTAGMPDFEQHGIHLGTDSSVQGAVILSGRFTYLDLLPNDPMIPRYEKVWGQRDQNLDTWRSQGALDYLHTVPMPLFLSINRTESPEALHQMEILKKRLNTLGSQSVFMLEEKPRGHKAPLDPQILTAMDGYIKSRLR